MGDPDHLLPLTEGIHGSTVIEVLKTSMVGEGGSSDSGSGLKKQQLETSTEALEDNQSNLIKSDLKTGEWVNAVQGKKKLTKYEMDIQIEDGVGSVSVPDEVFKDAAPLWEDFLIGRFLDKAPHIGKVHAIVNKIWALSDKSQMIDVYVINSTTMKFRVTNAATRNRIVRRAMWNIAEIPVVMAKWSPLTEDIEQETHSIPLWVHLKNVPMDMFSWKGLSFITSSVGVPERLHPETEQCVNLKIAKVFVKADLSKELPKTMNFTSQGKKTLVEYTYPWLPPKCTHCGKWGHLVHACRRRNEEKEVVLETKSGEVVRSVEEGGSKEKIKEVETGSVDTTENKKEDIMDILEKSVGSNKSAKNTIKEAGEEIWREVSPGKVSRTPQTNKKFESGQVSILSNSRFSVLSQDEEEGEIMKNKEEVVEVNKEEKRGNELEKEDDNEDLEKETTIVSFRCDCSESKGRWPE
ncbi:uncharacterized protein LOC130497999 [Raphanus sativus]|uniref:Uncharacterized protein LOC130497999 n=1 Tax=Raphanus sativus TaxID=3726 RepID=A0A9W3C763_RAPSA|nr:uncharacterized protein LOC130497999 [Raphanus sativus]